VTGILLGLQTGYTKFVCFWDSPAIEKCYTVKKWLARDDVVPTILKFKKSPSLNSEKVFLPPLHIKLGL